MNLALLLIRADASLSIGTGHVMRCLALAQAWQDAGGSARIVYAELPDALVPRLQTEGLPQHRVNVVAGSSEDAAETVRLARLLRPDWVVIDGDRFDSDFLQTIHTAGFRTLLIDDFVAREAFPADLIVNPNLDENEEPYRKRGATARILMGPSYVLLRREFRQSTGKDEASPSGNRILVTLGGSDPENLTPKIATALSQLHDLEVTVIVGASYDKTSDLQKLSAGNLRIVSNPLNMVPLMTDSDQAIIAAGGTLWELLSMGCAVLSYSRNAVQANVIQRLSRRGIVVNLGDTQFFTAAKLVDSVTNLFQRTARVSMTGLGRAMVDGLGATRVVEEMQQLGVQ